MKRKPKIAFIVIAAIGLAVGVVVQIEGQSGGIAVGILLAALFVFLAFKSKKPRRAAQPKRRQIPDDEYFEVGGDDEPDYSFDVFGTKYNNNDGASRQEFLKANLHTHNANRVVQVCPYKYQNENAYAVVLNDVQIGNIGRVDIPRYEQAIAAGFILVSIKLREYQGFYYARIQMDLPPRIKGFCKCVNGVNCAVVNENLDDKEKIKAAKHEVLHFLRKDLESDKPTKEIEEGMR